MGKKIFNLLTQVFLGLYIFTILAWPEYIKFYLDLDYPGLTPNRVLPLLLLPFLLYLGIKKYRIIIADTTLRSVIVISTVIILTFIISAYQSSYETASIKVAFFFIENTLVFSLIFYLLYEERYKKYYFKVLIYSISAIVLVGLLEFFKEENPLSQFVLTETELIAKNIEGQDRDGIHRISSIYNNPLSLAVHLLAFFPVLIFLMNRLGALYNIVILLNIGIIPVLILGTDSRVGIILWCLLFLYFVSSYLYRKSLQVLLVVSMFSFVVLTSLLFYEWSYFYSIFSAKFLEGSAKISSYNDRIMQFSVVFDKLSDSPVFGLGFGAANEIVYPLAAVDNLFLSVLLETGIWGALVNCDFVF